MGIRKASLRDAAPTDGAGLQGPTAINGHDVRNLTPILALLLGLLIPGALHAQSDEETLVESTGSDAQEPEPASPAEAALGQTPDAPANASGAAVAAIEEAIERLVQLEVSLAASATPGSEGARRELATVRSRLRDALVAVGQLQGEQDLRDWLREAGVVEPTEPVAEGDADLAQVEEAATGTLNDAELGTLTTTIEAAPFNEGKLQALREGLQGREVTSEQASSVLELFSFSRDRVDALVFLHPRIADGENFGVLLTALKFESDRKAVRDRLGLGG